MFNLSESEIHYAAPGFCAVRQLPVFHAPIDTKIPQAERRSASDRKQEEKNKDMDIYKGLVQYTLFFAPFFDGKMEYIQHKNSLRAVRKVLKIYGQDPLGKESFLEL